MNPVELLGAGVVLVAAVAVGTVTHELSHAAALRAFGVPYELEWFPDRDDDGLVRAGVAVGWASVTPRRIPHGLPPWRLRVAALMPLLLATPLALYLLGVLPDWTGNPYLTAATVGWLACALPSPQDFSLVWHAATVVDRNGGEEGSPEPVR